MDGKLCDERHETINKRLDNHEKEIVDLKVVMERVVTLIDRVNEQIETQKNKPSFWETDNGKMLFKWLIRLSVLIVCGAFGFNIATATGLIK